QPATAVAFALRGQPEPGGLDGGPGQWHTAQFEGDETADGVHLIIDVIGEVEVHLEFLLQVVPQVLEGQSRHHPVGTLGDLFNRGDLVIVVLIGDLTDDLLQDVLDGDQPGHATVFVDEDGDVVLLLLHLLQQGIQGAGVGDELGRTHDLVDGDGTAAVGGVVRLLDQVLQVDHTDDVIDILTDDRDAGMSGPHAQGGGLA